MCVVSAWTCCPSAGHLPEADRRGVAGHLPVETLRALDNLYLLHQNNRVANVLKAQ